MSFRLRLLFSGLCIFVPNNTGDRVRVMLVDARAPGNASNDKAHVSHIPAVRFKMNDLKESEGNKQAKHYIHHSAKEKLSQGMWVLNGDDLEIKAGNGEELADGKLNIDKNFSLVPMAKSIYNNGLDIKDDCFGASTDLKKVGVMARLKLKNGVLGAYNGESFAPQDNYGNTIPYLTKGKYYFSTPSSKEDVASLHKQQLATCVIFETIINTETVELFSANHKEGLVFYPSNGESVEIMIENGPPPGLEDARPSSKIMDVDFELVYRLAKNCPEEMRVPILCESEEAPVPLLCSGLVYNPHDKA